jgi:hypothetical protein
MDTSEVAFGLPNKYMLGAGLKNKYVVKANIPVYAGFKWIKPWLNFGHTVKEVFETGKDFNQDFNIGFAKAGKVYTHRNAEIVRWRYLEHPTNKYRIFECRNKSGSMAGYAATRELLVGKMRVLVIMELRAFSLSAKMALTNYVRSVSDCKYVVAISSGLETKEALILGMVRLPEAITPKKQVLVIRTENDITRKVFEYNWIIETGDWDGF